MINIERFRRYKMKWKVLMSMFVALIFSVILVAATSDLSIVGINSPNGNPGEAVDVIFTVENSAKKDIDAIEVISTPLVNNGDSIAVPEISDITKLVGGTTQDKTFTITLPSVPAGTYTGEVAVEDRLNSENKDVITYSVIVDAVNAFEVAPATLKITAQADDSKNERFTITNTGSTTLTFDLSTEGEFRDDDYDSIDLLFSDVEALAPGDSVEVILTADIDRMVDVGIYDGLVKVASNGIEEEISLAVEVQPKMCKYGVIGDLEVAIQEPDDNEEFTPGETIQADIRVDNHYSKDMDVIVELVLYDATDNEEIESVTSEDEEVDDGKAETFDLEFEIPTSDLDEDNEYYLYAMAYKKNDEEEHCIFDRVKLDLERGEDNVIVKEIDLNKNEYSCGDTVLVDVDVENIGTDDQEQVYVLLKSRDLGVELKSDKFDLDEYDDIDSKYTVSFEFELPSNVDADEYYLQAYVNYADNDLNSEFVKLVVNEDACAVQEITEPKLVLTPVESTITVKPGVLKFVIPLKLENIGGSPITFEIDVSDVSGWADVIGIEGPETLNANELYHAYVYMQLKGEVAEGVHNLRVNLRDANGLIQSKMLSVEVQDGTITTVTDEQNVAWLSGILSDKSKLFWFIGDAILIIVALLFIRMLLRR